MKRKALGKGLAALISDRSHEMTEHVRMIELDKILPASYQPRKNFDPESLRQLTDSIKTKGLILPILVRPLDSGFELVAGERRLRAAKLAGLNKIPAIVRKIRDPESIEIAIIENLQREDLNPIETASAYKILIEEHNLTQDKLAQTIGKDRTTITNTLRLLNLPETVQELILSHQLTTGHAKVLLSVKSQKLQIILAESTVKNQWSVRTLEQKMQHLQNRQQTVDQQTDPILEAALDKIRRNLATKVSIKLKKKSGGKIILDFYSDNDLIRLLDLLGA